ncbi:methionyl-tRNA formyltransferase [Campylobacter hyointestinalis]|uniref:methionyl-tRNA formyltransferase n=1 Tax=Campylobacter hyointestinalis TaxID=198 RepID=UPI0009EDF1DB|nr:methionyl-tRNA formyltransferase [Campylobacter hyointestinalis]
MDNSLSFAFFGATNYSKELLEFFIERNLIPKVIFSIPKEFYISYSKTRVKNTNYANLKIIADRYKIPYYEVNSIDGKKIKDYEFILKDFNLDLILVLGWYYMIPKHIRDTAKYGAWGIHASLLPKFAGGAPLNWAIIKGEKSTGVTLFRMENGVDNGDIIYQKSFDILYTDNIKDVYEKATLCSKEILELALKNINNIQFTPQDMAKIEIYPQRKPEDGKIDWNKNAIEIYNFIRAQTIPYPCAFSYIDKICIKIINSNIVNIDSSDYVNGSIVNIDGEILVATNDKFLELGEINDGKQKYQFKDYARANNLWGGYSRAKNLKMVA